MDFKWLPDACVPLKRTKQLKAEGLTLETSAFKLFTVADGRYHLSWESEITLQYSHTDEAPQFL